jgi:NTP pyrophosphatase (non-canonical NTP hydrolase)
MPSKPRRPSPAAPADTLAALQAAVAAFNRERRWRQFHAPKNLAMALAIEAAELMEPFRWMTPSASWRAAREGPTADIVRDELADVMLLALSMADYLGLDLLAVTRAKLERNRVRYPVDRARGRADKYTAYETDGDGDDDRARRATRKRPRRRGGPAGV